MNERYEQLDSLRGLAATSVVLSHIFLIIPSLFIVDRMKFTPLHIFWSGHEAVILFFILSGFVLSLPFIEGRAPKYSNYLIRRICRIYLPYIVSIIASIFCISLFIHGNIQGLSRWFIERWSEPITINQVVNHTLMLGDFQSAYINNVVWSLVHEMRISIIFPILMILVMKLNWKKNIIIGLLCSTIYFVVWITCIKFLNFNITKFDTSYLLTLHYIGFFILGALLAKHRQFFLDLYSKFSKFVKLLVLAGGILAYTYVWWFLPNVFYLHFSFINDWIIAIGSSILIIYCLCSSSLRKLMMLKPIHFVGKTSYSLYLFHMTVMLTSINVLHGKLPTSVILATSLILSFVVASITYYLIEKPSIKLGKFLIDKQPPKSKNDGIKKVKNQFV